MLGTYSRHYKYGKKFNNSPVKTSNSNNIICSTIINTTSASSMHPELPGAVPHPSPDFIGSNLTPRIFAQILSHDKMSQSTIFAQLLRQHRCNRGADPIKRVPRSRDRKKGFKTLQYLHWLQYNLGHLWYILSWVDCPHRPGNRVSLRIGG